MMAGRTLDRRELRRQSDQAEQNGESEPDDADEADDEPAAKPAAKKPRAKAPPKPRVKRPRKAKVPPRMRARWGVFDNAMKQVAVFDYNQRAAAEGKLADLLARNKGLHFMQIVKEPMPEPAPAEAPAE
jgi:hypothetical protein